MRIGQYHMWLLVGAFALFVGIPVAALAMVQNEQTRAEESLLLVAAADSGMSSPGETAPPSGDVEERGVPLIRDLNKRPDLVGRKVSSGGCGPGRIGTAEIEVKNQGTTLAGAFFTEVNSFSKLTRVRTGQLPPGGAFTHKIQVGCPPVSPCAVNGTVDIDREVAESNETNNVFSFTCP